MLVGLLWVLVMFVIHHAGIGQSNHVDRGTIVSYSKETLKEIAFCQSVKELSSKPVLIIYNLSSFMAAVEASN